MKLVDVACREDLAGRGIVVDAADLDLRPRIAQLTGDHGPHVTLALSPDDLALKAVAARELDDECAEIVHGRLSFFGAMSELHLVQPAFRIRSFEARYRALMAARSFLVRPSRYLLSL